MGGGVQRHLLRGVDKTDAGSQLPYVHPAETVPEHIELARSTDDEKQSQLARLAAFHARHADASPAMLARLQQAVIANGNVFEVLMDAVRCCSLGQITAALFEVGGQYRRSM
jgi:methylmalonyl-CoA mutase